jgi:hypothetical protein
MSQKILARKKRNGVVFLVVGLEDYIIKGRSISYPMDGRLRYHLFCWGGGLIVAWCGTVSGDGDFV